METIIIPVDGASNVKLEVLDFHSLQPLFSRVAETPVKQVGGLEYNDSATQFDWYAQMIASLSAAYRSARVIAPAARGASGGLIGRDGSLCEAPGRGLTLSYNQRFPERVEARFRLLAGSEEEFYLETGSVRDFPGSLTLVKRFLYEEMERPEVLARASAFAHYGALLAGYFLGPDYLAAAGQAGNEHTYWMCHTGARDINAPPGTPGGLCIRIGCFRRLVPVQPAVAYCPLGTVPSRQAAVLGLSPRVLVLPGGHDTCLSHLPVLAAFRRNFPARSADPLIHLEAGSWTLAARIGGPARLQRDGYRRAVIVQGSLDGAPVVTSMYGGGRDFRHVLGLIEDRGGSSGAVDMETLLARVLKASDCFVLPNIAPENHRTGPFPWLRGQIVNPQAFCRDRGEARVLANLCVAITAAHQVETVSGQAEPPVVVTGGGARDKCFGRLVATLSHRKVYALFDSRGEPVSETTTLGAGMNGKAACLGVHPENIELDSLGLTFREYEPFGPELAGVLERYREMFMRRIEKAREHKESEDGGGG